MEKLISKERITLYILFGLMGFSFLFGIVTSIPKLFENITSYSLINNIFNPSREQIDQIKSLRLHGCSAIFQARAVAAYDIDAATIALNNARNCEFQYAYYFLGGELAFRKGDPNSAIIYLNNMDSWALTTWGRHEYYSGDREKAEIILQTALNNLEKTEHIPDLKKADLYTTLASIYREKGDIKKSSELNRKAWEYGSNSYMNTYYLSYQLGRDYFNLGMVDDALYVLQIGLDPDTRGPMFLSQLDFSYYELLVKCYAQTGNLDRALYYYDLASNAIEEEIRRNTSSDVIEQQYNRIKYLAELLEIKE